MKCTMPLSSMSGATVGALRVRAEIIFTAFGTGVGQRYGPTASAQRM